MPLQWHKQVLYKLNAEWFEKIHLITEIKSKMLNFWSRDTDFINNVKHFLIFYRRHSEWISKYYVGLKTLLHKDLFEPELYVDLVHTLRKKYKTDFWNNCHSLLKEKLQHVYSVCMLVNPIMVVTLLPSIIHYKNTPIQIYWNFTTRKWKFSDENTDISAQNIDCGYSLEPLRQGGSNEYP